MIISFPGAPLERSLHLVSAFTLIMTVPQVLGIWVNHNASGVSLAAWSAYLISAVLWLLHGLRKHDRSIYIPCIGWITLDLAIVIGILMYR